MSEIWSEIGMKVIKKQYQWVKLFRFASKIQSIFIEYEDD